jgi:hypothetical protein
MKVELFAIFFLLSISIVTAQDKSKWSFEVHGGAPLNIPLPLTIEQNGSPIIKLNAQYYSEPFKMPVFWIFRISKWKNNKAWELEFKHQKLYLKNTPEEVQYFNITHGFNQLTINRARKFNWIKNSPFIIRNGIGIVLAHPESEIRGKEFDQQQSFLELGYYIAGPTINVALAKQFPLSNRLYFNAETKLSLSYARLPVVDGHALVWHSAMEFVFGLGYNFIKK